MPLDSNIFFQGAALRQANDARLQQQIGSVFDRLAAARLKQQELESDPKRKLQAAAERMVMGEATPADEVLLKATSALEGPKMQMVTDELGNMRAVPAPTMFDSLSAMSQRKPYQPQYQPVGQIGQADLSGVDIPQVDMGMAMPSGQIPPPMKPGNQLIDNLMRQDVFKSEAQQIPQIASEGDMGTPKGRAARVSAQASLEEKAALEKIKADIEQSQSMKKEALAIPQIEKMIEINKLTSEKPYAGSEFAQPYMRFKNPVASEAMDLLERNRKDLAAPLAKQLGVNPTDKDFKATLDRIFDRNASRSSREKQMMDLIRTIQEKQGKTVTYDPLEKLKQEANIKELPQGARVIGASGGKKVYQLPDGSHVMEQ